MRPSAMTRPLSSTTTAVTAVFICAACAWAVCTSWIALGDAYWKTEQPDKAKTTWREALKLFPANGELKARLARDGDDLEKYIYDQLDPNKRVDTNLAPLWEE